MWNNKFSNSSSERNGEKTSGNSQQREAAHNLRLKIQVDNVVALI